MQVKWALRSITLNKVRGGDGIPAELFQILKGDAVKVLHSIRQQIWKTQQWPQDWKRSVFIIITKKSHAKEYTNHHQFNSFHTLEKSYSKYSNIGFSSMGTKNFQMHKLDLEEAEDPEIKLPTSAGSAKKLERVPEKHLFLLY